MGDSRPSVAVSSSSGSPSYTVDARVIRFRQELKSNTINLVDVSKLAYEGVPDKYGLRPLVWKVQVIVTERVSQKLQTWDHCSPQGNFLCAWL